MSFRNLIYLALLAIILVVGFSLPNVRANVYATLNELKLIPTEEHFTELYFENASSLPKQIIGGMPISFSFTIHNLEGATTPYPYQVYFEYPTGSKMIIATDTISLADKELKTISISHSFTKLEERGVVVVELTSLNQRIDFLVPNHNS